MMIKIDKKNIGKIRTAIAAKEMDAKVGYLDVEVIFKQMWRAEHLMDDEGVPMKLRRGTILNIYPAMPGQTAPCVKLVRRVEDWFLVEIYRQKGTNPESGTKLRLPEIAREYDGWSI